MRKLIISVSIAAAAMILTSCASMYIPTGNNTPLLEEKHEAQIEVGTSNNSLYLMTAFALTDKWAIMANGTLSYYNFTNRYSIIPDKHDGNWLFDSDDYYAHQYYELGVGRFNLTKLKRLKLEVFGGGGYGYASDSHFKETPMHDNKYFLIFVQGNIAYKHLFTKDRTFEIGASYRFAYSRFTESFYFENEELNKSTNWNNIHFEPVLFVKGGTESVRVIFKVGASLKPVSPFFHDGAFVFDGPSSTFFHTSIGLNIKIGGNKQKAER